MSLGKEWSDEWYTLWTSAPPMTIMLSDFLDKKIAELRIKDAAKFMSEELKFKETIRKYFDELKEKE